MARALIRPSCRPCAPRRSGTFPSNGGRITICQIVLLSQLDLTPFTFLDGPRTDSPIVSALRATPKWNISFEWRTDYDPARHGIVASTASADWRKGGYFISVGH